MRSCTQPLLRSLLVLGALVALPSSAVASATKGETTAPKARVDKRAAKQLCAKVKAAPRFEALAKDAAANPLADEICRFYAVHPAAKQKYWDQLLAAAVEEGKLSRKDSRTLSTLLVAPTKTLAAWEPETEFGRSLLARVHDDDEQTGNVAYSTAGDVGTIAGAILGGLGGSPASVALGAALGKLAGETANVLGQAAYDLAPDNGEGDEDGGDEGDGGGGDGGGGENK